jgi:DNA-binding transcriptional regulator YiaG
VDPKAARYTAGSPNLKTRMSNLGVVLKSEIIRLARKETRIQVEPLRKANSLYRREIAELKRQVATLGRQLKSTRKDKEIQTTPDAETAASNVRFSAKSVRPLRSKLGLSVAEFATLIGSSSQSVYNWEAGTTAPQPRQVAAMAALRSVGRREVQARLSAMAD